MSLIKNQRIKRQKAEIKYFENTAHSLFKQRINKPYSYPIVECHLHLKKLALINSNLKFHYPMLDETSLVINICAGSGMEAEFLSRNFPTMKIVALDLSKDMCLCTLYRAKRRYLSQNLDIICADGSKLPFKDEVSHLVYFYEGLHHIPDYLKAIEEGNRILKSQGYYLLLEPFVSKVIQFFLAKLKFQRAEYFGFPTYKFLIGDMKELFSKFNYNLIILRKIWDFYPRSLINLIENHPNLLRIFKFLNKCVNFFTAIFFYCSSMLLFKKDESLVKKMINPNRVVVH